MKSMDSERKGNSESVSLPTEYVPKAVEHFEVEGIILSKGSLDTAERETFVRRICEAYPRARVEEQPDTPASRVVIEAPNPFIRNKRGKKTLVLGELQEAVRCTENVECIRPAYWHFSIYSNCPYGCQYCYLGGTRGVWFSPGVRVYLNLRDIIARIDKVAGDAGKPTGFFLGRLQDGLALDPLTGYSTALVPFFARHRFARQILLTKSDAVDNLLELDHQGNTIMCWTLNIPEVAESYESNVPTVEARIVAMERCAERGYPVRALIRPVITHEKWRNSYIDFVEHLVPRVPLQRLGFGGIYSNGRVAYLTRRELGGQYNVFFGAGAGRERCSSARWYRCAECRKHYGDLVDTALAVRPELEVGPCHIL